jgi:Leucine-rich repeat (LRR) protein
MKLLLKYWFLLIIFSLIFPGCKTRKVDNDVYHQEESEKTNIKSTDKSSFLDDIDGLSSDSFYRMYSDKYRNLYYLLDDGKNISCHLESPNIEVLLQLQDYIEKLQIYYTNPITDIAFLENFTQIKELNIRGKKIETLAPVRHLTNLEHLEIESGYPKIIDCTIFKDLKNLKMLYIYFNKIENIDSLFELTNLEILRVGDYEDKIDIKNISSLINLKELWIYSTEINLAPIGELQKLNKLGIGSPVITNFIYLTNPMLEELFLTGIKSHSELRLDGLINLNQLSRLFMVGFKIHDVKPLLKLTSLESVIISDSIVDITPLVESDKSIIVDVDEYVYNNIPKEIIEKYNDKIYLSYGD